ncbi:rhamnan synthesis F family protein [Brachyspira pilosicoli]|uniref:rhamnan synthesis F family protein n=1 Tax=Brachyspira pilosicoli TaxID=52584 RepID=UPI003007D48A
MADKEIKRLVILAGYDKDNIIDDYVVYFIKELKKIADIIYVSNCYFNEKELSKISNYCIATICEPHGESDWGSYKRGFRYSRISKLLFNYDYLILVNDSIYGPFYDLKHIVETMELKNLDAWSMFYCFYDFVNLSHLQGYFVSIKKEVFLSEDFTFFMYSITKLHDKLDLIIHYETGLTKFFQKHNYKIGGYFDSLSIKTENDSNFPFHDAKEIIKLGFPFLKRSILLNPTVFSFTPDNLNEIIDLVKYSYDINMIKKNIERTSNIDFYSLTQKNTKIKELQNDKEIIYFSLLIINKFSLFSITGNYKYIKINFLGINITIKK